MRIKRAINILFWTNFKIEFKNKFYIRHHQKKNEQEFLALRQEGMTLIEYKR
jgi:hypothetical protein